MTLRHSIDLLHILGGSGSAATKDECLVAVWMIPSCKYILLTEDRRAGLDISPWLHEGSRSFAAAVISREEKNKITCKCFIAHILVTKKKKSKRTEPSFLPIEMRWSNKPRLCVLSISVQGLDHFLSAETTLHSTFLERRIQGIQVPYLISCPSSKGRRRSKTYSWLWRVYGVEDSKKDGTLLQKFG